jgi:hypothetical protein
VTVSTNGADWCVESGALTICGTQMVERSRTSEGVKWCFYCRKRHEFWRVLWVPDGPSYYEPYLTVDGVKDDCTDLFPGWTREWGED